MQRQQCPLLFAVLAMLTACGSGDSVCEEQCTLAMCMSGECDDHEQVLQCSDPDRPVALEETCGVLLGSQCPPCESGEFCVQHQRPDCTTSAKCVARPESCTPNLGPGAGCSAECMSLCEDPYQCGNVPTVGCGSEDLSGLVCYGP